jgi:hypothetical protein
MRPPSRLFKMSKMNSGRRSMRSLITLMLMKMSLWMMLRLKGLVMMKTRTTQLIREAPDRGQRR